MIFGVFCRDTGVDRSYSFLKANKTFSLKARSDTPQ
jgi:hypothetical protein